MSEGVKGRLRSSQQTHLGKCTEGKDARQQAGSKRSMTGQQDKPSPVKKPRRNKASEALQRAVASTNKQEEHAKAAQHKQHSTPAADQAGEQEQGTNSTEQGKGSDAAKDVKQGSKGPSTKEDTGSGERKAVHEQDGRPSKQGQHSSSRQHSSSQQQQGTGGQQQGDKASPAGKSPAAKGERRAEQAEEAPKADLPDSVKAEALKTVHINRAPREGFSRAAGLSFGKAISGMLAQSKGRSLGLIQPKDRTDEERAQQRGDSERAGFAEHEVFGMHILAKEVDDDGDVRALDSKQQVVKDTAVQGYLKRAFGDRLQDAEAALKELADAHEPGEIGSHAYRLYERFRPTVQSGTGGWGQKGELDLEKIRSMAAEQRR